MNTLPPQILIECLGWSLVHFLWQGVAVAVWLALCLRILRGSPANQRYLAGCFALLFMIALPAITFNRLVRQQQPMVVPPALAAPAQEFAAPFTPGALAAGIPTARFSLPVPVRRAPSLSERFENALPWLVILWAAGVVTFSGRLLASWLQVRRLRRAATSPIGEPWQSRLTELAERLRVSAPVQLLQSALIEAPATIGWLRPVILLPVSCLAGLTPGQLDAVLAHELAHIRRHDYFVNLLQSVVETLLFYHPAVWWVSRRIREAREHCCDDLAVEVCGDRVAYVRALATLEELRLASPQLLLAASTAPLLQRIRRLAGRPETRTRPTGWLLGALLVATAAAALLLGVRNGNGGVVEADDAKRPAVAPASLNPGDNVLELEYVDGGQPATVIPSPHFVLVGVTAPPGVPLATVMPLPHFRMREVAQAGGGPRTGRRAILAKLDQLVLDSVEYDGVPLSVVLEQLGSRSKELDPDQQGINFMFDPTKPLPAGALDPNTGLPAIGLPGGAPDLEGVAITIKPALKHLRLADALEAICKGANLPIRFSIEDYAVRFWLNQSTPGIYTRVFRVDPNTFSQGLESVATIPFGNLQSGGAGAGGGANGGVQVPRVQVTPGASGSGTTGGGPGNSGGGGISNVTKPTASAGAVNTIRQFLIANGVDFSTNNPANANKAVFFGDQKGLLYVRSTPADLEAVARIIEGLNAGAPVPGSSNAPAKTEVPPRAETNNPAAAAKPNEARTDALVHDAKILFEAGKLDTAQMLFETALAQDPRNLPAQHYLELIKNKKLAQSACANGQPPVNVLVEVEESWDIPLRAHVLEPSHNQATRTNLTYTSKGRQGILAKLDQLILDSVEYDGVPLSAIMDQLTRRAGINFYLNREIPTVGGAIDPNTGLPVPYPDVGWIEITIKPGLKHIRLADALDAICKGTSQKIRYVIEDYAVSFSLADPRDDWPRLFSRTFRVDTNAFLHGLESMGASPPTAIPEGEGAQFRREGTNSTTNTALQIRVRQFLATKGVDLDASNPTNAGKAVFFNDRKGILYVRSTLADLGLIAAIFPAPNSVTNAAPASTTAQSDATDQTAKLFFEAGKLEEARILFEAALKQDPQNRAATHYLKLIQDKKQGKLNQAEESWDVPLRRFPQAPGPGQIARTNLNSIETNHPVAVPPAKEDPKPDAVRIGDPVPLLISNPLAETGELKEHFQSMLDSENARPLSLSLRGTLSIVNNGGTAMVTHFSPPLESDYRSNYFPATKAQGSAFQGLNLRGVDSNHVWSYIAVHGGGSVSKTVSKPEFSKLPSGAEMLFAQASRGDLDLASQEALRRQAYTYELRQKLKLAQTAQQAKDAAAAAKLYEACYSLVRRIGSSVDAESKMVVSNLCRVELDLAREAQRKQDYQGADERIKRVLILDPANETALKSEQDNDRLAAAQAGLHPSQEALDREAGGRTNQIHAATLVQNAKLLFENGKLDDAEKELQAALNEDPDNPAAVYYLKLVDQTRMARATRQSELRSGRALIEAERAWDTGSNNTAPQKAGEVSSPTGTPISPAYATRTYYVNPNAFRKGLENLPGAMPGKPGSSDLSQIQAATRQYFTSAGVDFNASDPANTGKAVLYNERRGTLFVRATPADMALVQAAVDALNATAPQLSPEFKGTVAPDVAPATNHGASGARSGPGQADPAALYSRTYRVDPATFYKGLVDAGLAQSATNNSISFVSELRRFFIGVGVDFDTNNAANAGKAVFFNDRKGILYVRSTVADLDLVQAALDALTAAPPQLNLKVTVAEIDEAQFPAGKLEALLAATGAKFFTNAVPPVLKFHPEPGTNILQNPGYHLTNSIHTEFQAELTDLQYQLLKKELGAAPGVTLINALSEVTSEVGRWVAWQNVNPLQIVTGASPAASTRRKEEAKSVTDYQVETVPCGLDISLRSALSADELGIALMVSPTETDFLGYDDPGSFVPADAPGGSRPVTAVLPLPHFKVGQFEAQATMWDGATLVLGGLVRESAAATKSPSFRDPSSAKTRKHLLLFITPTLINPDGSRFHSEDEISAARSKQK